MANLHMEALSDREVAEVVDQGLASLNARLEDRDELRLQFPNLCGEDIDELATALRRACDEWDRFADLLPGFRET
jgi:phage terminase Nu1 subunit (DNA packaging protein)